jgi:hypothetical protein
MRRSTTNPIATQRLGHAINPERRRIAMTAQEVRVRIGRRTAGRPSVSTPYEHCRLAGRFRRGFSGLGECSHGHSELARFPE